MLGAQPVYGLKLLLALIMLHTADSGEWLLPRVDFIGNSWPAFRFSFCSLATTELLRSEFIDSISKLTISVFKVKS